MLTVLGTLGLPLPFEIVRLPFSSMWTIISYVLTALALYTIAKRRGIQNPWLAWIPVGRMWILGCISDQYQYVVNGAVKNKRKILLVLNIVLIPLAIVMGVILVAALVYLGLNANGELDFADVLATFASVGGAGALSLVLTGVSIATMVVQYMALYDVFASCEPANKLLYLLLSIFIGFTKPIFLLLCQNKDLGMPPRRDAIQQTAELWERRQ